MAMSRSPKKHSKKALALTNPNPSFVSLVRAGANMTPFLSVKSAEGKFEDNDMALKVTKSDTHDIAGFVFRKAAFKDEAAVKEWLDNGGYSDYEIVAKDDGDFSVAGVEGLSEVTEVEGDGVVVLAGKRAETTEKVEKTETEKASEAEAASGLVTARKSEGGAPDKDEAGNPVPPVEVTSEKTEEVAPVADKIYKSFNSHIVVKADGSMTIVEGGGLNEDDAGATVAPTLEEVVAKATTMISAIAGAGVEFPAQKGTYTVSEIGYVLQSLKWLADDATWNGLSDASVQGIKSAAGTLIGVLVDAMQGTIDNFVEAFKAEQVAKEEAEKVAKAAENDPIALLTKRMDALEAANKELTTENEGLKASKTAAETRVKSLEDGARQTRKSADAADAAAAADKEPAEGSAKKGEPASDSDYVSQRRIRSILGG